MDFHIVVAYTIPDHVIGNKGKMPWPRLATDMGHFKTLTTKVCRHDCQNAVVMGRKTWESLPKRPLPNRLNCVISTTVQKLDGAEVFTSLDVCFVYLAARDKVESCYVIGGGQLYSEAVRHHNLASIYATEIYARFPGNVHFPKQKKWTTEATTPVVMDNGLALRFVTYKRKLVQHPEMQYLNLLQNVLTHGEQRSDRTGTGTFSTFGRRIEFSLDNNTIPLLTTKRVFWRGVTEELLWFLRGSTDAKELQDKKIRIWDGNSTREFLNGRGLSHYKVGELGPVYGFQWRHFGASYAGSSADYSAKGVDQIETVIEQLKTNPRSRRIVCSAWNPSDLSKMALPPCHILFQFYVDADFNLSCQMYQRSADLFLGLPFNIASYSLLTHIIAQRTGLTPGKLSICIGDAHIYKNHVDACMIQLARNPTEFPTLNIKRMPEKIGDYRYDDFEVNGYIPQKTIRAPMSA